MDISKSNTESFVRYLRFHEKFNRTVKVATTSLNTLKRIVDVPNGDILLGVFVDSNDKPWGKSKRYPNTEEIIDSTIISFSEMSLVESLSAFDWYTAEVISELCQFSPKVRETKFTHAHTDSEYKPTKPIDYQKCCVSYGIQYSNNHRLATRLEQFGSDLEITSHCYLELLPLFHYFRLVRNCYAHYNGRIDKELENHIKNPRFSESLTYWNNLCSNLAPDLPVGIQGDKINFSNLNSIMSSAVCFELAKIINIKAVELLELDGIYSMAAFHSLLSTYHEFRKDNHRFPEGAVANFLSNRYSVKDVNTKEIPRELKRLEIWRHCFKRHGIIYKSHL